jgi:transposase
MDQRTELQNRLLGGQKPKGIAKDMGVSERTIWRLKKAFGQDDGTYHAVAAQKATRQKTDRQMMLDLSEIVKDAPKITLEELRSKAIEDEIFESEEQAPDKHDISKDAGYGIPVQTSTYG